LVCFITAAFVGGVGREWQVQVGTGWRCVVAVQMAVLQVVSQAVDASEMQVLVQQEVPGSGAFMVARAWNK
jgi:hypothetical protein